MAISLIEGITGINYSVSTALQIARNLSDVANVGSARDNLGLGTMATQNANAVAITGGTISGVNLTVSGGINTTGIISAGGLNVTGDILAATGQVTTSAISVTNRATVGTLNVTTVGTDLNASGFKVTASAGNFTTSVSAASLHVDGTISANAVTVNGLIATNGDINATGGRISASAATLTALLTGQAASFSSIVSASLLNATGDINTPTGKVNASAANFTAAVSAASLHVDNTVSANALALTGNLSMPGGQITASAATFTAAVSAGSLHVDNTVSANALNLTADLNMQAGRITASAANITGAVSANSLHVNNVVSAASLNVTGDIAAATGLVTASAATVTNLLNAGSLNMTSSTVPSNGVYLPVANNLGFSTGGAAHAYMDSSGRILIGNASAQAVQGLVPYLEVLSTGQEGASIAVYEYSNNTNTPFVILAKSRGATIGTNTLVSAGDSLGQISWAGADGSGLTSSATIDTFVDSGVAAGRVPGKLTIKTANSAGTLTTGFVMDASQFITMIGVNNATTGTAANVNVDGSGNLKKSTSSLQYKIPKGNYTKGMDKLKQLIPISYAAKNDPDGQIYAGFYAEDIDALGMSEFVIYQNGKPDGLAYGNMMALAANAIKELEARVAALEAKS